MASAYIDYPIVTNTADIDAYSLSAADDTLFLATPHGALMAFGEGAYGLYISYTATDARAVIEGVVYGAAAGIVCASGTAVIQVNGSVSSAGVGVILGGGALVVGPDGFVSGEEAVIMEGDGTVTNWGVISGHGARAFTLHTDDNVIINHGEISGGIEAIVLKADETLVKNTGFIFGSVVSEQPDQVQKLTIDNSGTWVGAVSFTGDVDFLTNSGVMGEVFLMAGNDSVHNTGLLELVHLGDGSDLLNSRRGDVGDVVAGLGGDFVWAGLGDNTIYGDDGGGGLDGADTIRGGVGDDVLLGGSGSDSLRGDDDDDELRGGDQADLLLGGRGDDVLAGDKGGDNLRGGAGHDVLTGGDQGDLFVFRPGFDHDIITDFFAEAGGKHDVIQFSRALFGAFGGIQAKMSQVGSDVVIKVSNEDTLVLQNVDLAAMTADDFGFVS